GALRGGRGPPGPERARRKRGRARPAGRGGPGTRRAGARLRGAAPASPLAFRRRRRAAAHRLRVVEPDGEVGVEAVVTHRDQVVARARANVERELALLAEAIGAAV